jgi:N-acetylmuramoyl-L-alanine amidase
MRWVGVVVILGLGVRAWAAPVTLDSIEVGRDRGAVTLHLSSPAEARAAVLGAAGDAPDRIYIDLPGVSLGHGAPTVVPGSGNVVRVRTGQFATDTTRVVLDLGHAEPFALRVKGSTITIHLGSAHLTPPRTFARDRPPPAAMVAEATPPPSPPAVAPAAPPPPPVVASVAKPPPAPPAPAPARAPREIEGPPPPPPGLAVAPAKKPAEVAAAPAQKPADVAAARRAPIFPLPVIVLDAGHGGRDPGAEGVGGVQEKDIALRIIQRLAARLPTRVPAIVVLTRADDSFVSIERRLAVPNDQAAAFISVHANASSDPTLHGVEIFYGGGSVQAVDMSGASPQSASLGRFLGDALRPQVELLRRPRPGDFGVLVRNRVPSALVEIGYLTHPKEAVRAQDPAYHAMVADALADGIAAYLQHSAAAL